MVGGPDLDGAPAFEAVFCSGRARVPGRNDRCVALRNEFEPRLGRGGAAETLAITPAAVTSKVMYCKTAIGHNSFTGVTDPTAWDLSRHS